mmetsp:Transcript_12972/g.25370  ORF Transcript_12972/g.25370 Transcript_12972/m.25370 type:complete len:80 (+) Transcript_12972:993-1232(+)
MSVGGGVSMGGGLSMNGGREVCTGTVLVTGPGELVKGRETMSEGESVQPKRAPDSGGIVDLSDLRAGVLWVQDDLCTGP